MSAVLDNAGMIAGDPAIVVLGPRKPPMLRNNALMDAIFRNVTRGFAFLVFSLLAAIVVSLDVPHPPGPSTVSLSNWLFSRFLGR